jgi:hypothetical protein
MSQASAQEGSLGVLFSETAGVVLGVELDGVWAVALQPETVPLETGCAFLKEYFVFRGAPVGILDVARWLGREHDQPLVDRKLVILKSRPSLALCVDDLREPEIVSLDRVVREGASSKTAAPMASATIAAVRAGSSEAFDPIVDPAAMVPPELRERLAELLLSEAQPSARIGLPSPP